jgi:hypothetical protein
MNAKDAHVVDVSQTMIHRLSQKDMEEIEHALADKERFIHVGYREHIILLKGYWDAIDAEKGFCRYMSTDELRVSIWERKVIVRKGEVYTGYRFVIVDRAPPSPPVENKRGTCAWMCEWFSG